MAGQQHFFLGFCLRQFLFQLAQRGLQCLHLRGLIRDLFLIVLRKLLAAPVSCQRRARQVVLLLIHCALRLAQPIGGGGFIFFLLFFEHVLIGDGNRSEEHTSELQSRRDLVCRLLLEKKKKKEFLPHYLKKKKKKNKQTN